MFSITQNSLHIVLHNVYNYYNNVSGIKCNNNKFIIYLVRINTRSIIALSCLVALAIIYALRVNISVAMVSMQNYTAAEQMAKRHKSGSTNEHCNFNQEKLQLEDGPFIFSNTEISIMFSSYYWGYLIAMIPGSTTNH